MARKYIAVEYDSETQQNMKQWCEVNGLDLACGYNGEQRDPNDFDFHTTVFYSINEADPKQSNGKHKLDRYRAVPTGFKLLGENEDIPVLQLAEEGYIKHLREHFKRLGLRDRWDNYIPHMSLSYSRTKVDFNGMALPSFPLYFDKLVVRDIEE